MPGRFDTIPVIDIAPLFGGAGAARARVDAAIGHACREAGFLIVTGQPEAARLDHAGQRRLLAFFGLPEEVKRSLARHQNNPANRNIYRGWFPALAGERSYKEGIDFGPDLPARDPRVWPREALFEANPWPPEALLPGWRAAVVAYWGAMNRLGFVLLRSIARHLGLPEDFFDASFADSNASLRLLRYPPPCGASAQAGLTWTAADPVSGAPRHIVAAAHSDSGCLTLLSQDSMGGLQARNGRDDWVEVPPIEGSLVVNIGDTLARWTNDTFRATRHRVVGPARERFSIPYFFEPRFDTLIECLPVCAGAAGPRYAPVGFGEHLLAKMSSYTEFRTLFRDGVLERPPAAEPAVGP